jgi:hypothetical protein
MRPTADLSSFVALCRPDRLGQHVGEAGQEIDVVTVVAMRPRAVDLQHAVGPAVPLDDHVHNRDDAVVGVQGRQRED